MVTEQVIFHNQVFEAKYDDSKCDVVHLHFVHDGGLCKTVPWSEVYPQPGHACYDCGSTVPGHHSELCDLTGPGDVKDLPAEGRNRPSCSQAVRKDTDIYRDFLLSNQTHGK